MNGVPHKEGNMIWQILIFLGLIVPPQGARLTCGDDCWQLTLRLDSKAQSAGSNVVYDDFDTLWKCRCEPGNTKSWLYLPVRTIEYDKVVRPQP